MLKKQYPTDKYMLKFNNNNNNNNSKKKQKKE